MKKIKIVAIALAAFVFCFAASCDNGTTGGSAGASSDENLFYGKWESERFPNDFYEYKSDGAWSYTYEGEIIAGGTWYLLDYEGRSIFVEERHDGTYLLIWGYDYEFSDGGNELRLNWIGNFGGNVAFPDIKVFVRRRMD